MILIRTSGGKSADFPSSWDELTPRQVRHVWRLQNRCLRSGGSPLELSVSILLYLLGIRRLPRARGGLLRENLYMLCDRCLGFMFPGDGAALQYTSTVNPMPCIGFRRGPADLLQNLTFGEFRHAAAALQAYARSHDAADLDECVGCRVCCAACKIANDVPIGIFLEQGSRSFFRSFPLRCLPWALCARLRSSSFRIPPAPSQKGARQQGCRPYGWSRKPFKKPHWGVVRILPPWPLAIANHFPAGLSGAPAP